MTDNKYCYPNTGILKNKLNIRGAKKLEDAEREITARASVYLRAEPLRGDFDFAHLMAIHKTLFSSLYDWAGQPRTVDIGKGVQFATVEFLEDNALKIFRDLKRDNYLIGLPYEKAIKKLAYYLGEINVLHPFREGNGRAQRIFIAYLAEATGLSLDFSKCDSGRMLEASKYSAIAVDNTKFEAILKDISTPISLAEQKEFLRSVSPVALAVFEKTKGIPDRKEECGTEKPGKAMSMSDWQSQIAKIKANGGASEKDPHTKSKKEIQR